MGYHTSNIEPGYNLTPQQLQCPGVFAQCPPCCPHRAPQGEECLELAGARVRKYHPCAPNCKEKHTWTCRCFPHHHHPSPVHHKLQQTATEKDNFILKSLQSSLEKFNLSLLSDSLRKEQLFGKVILQHVKQLFIFALQN